MMKEKGERKKKEGRKEKEEAWRAGNKRFTCLEQNVHFKTNLVAILSGRIGVGCLV